MRPDFVSNPFLWGGLAPFFCGLALGEALRWISSLARKDGRGAARKSTAALCAFAVSIASSAAFLVFSGRQSLGEPFLVAWGAILGVLGLASGLWPRAAGIPVFALVLALTLFLLESISGWLPLRGPVSVARLTAFSVDAEGFKGELEVLERDTVPIVQKVKLPISSAALVVERLDFSGPATLVAGKSYYRVVGLAGLAASGDALAEASGAASAAVAKAALRMAVSFPLHKSLLEKLTPLPEGIDVAGKSLFVERRRMSSMAVLLSAFEPVLYSFESGGSAGEGPGSLLLAGDIRSRMKWGSGAWPPLN